LQALPRRATYGNVLQPNKKLLRSETKMRRFAAFLIAQLRSIYVKQREANFRVIHAGQIAQRGIVELQILTR